MESGKQPPLRSLSGEHYTAGFPPTDRAWFTANQQGLHPVQTLKRLVWKRFHNFRNYGWNFRMLSTSLYKFDKTNYSGLSASLFSVSPFLCRAFPSGIKIQYVLSF
jgi:hypothetical protein